MSNPYRQQIIPQTHVFPTYNHTTAGSERIPGQTISQFTPVYKNTVPVDPDVVKSCAETLMMLPKQQTVSIDHLVSSLHKHGASPADKIHAQSISHAITECKSVEKLAGDVAPTQLLLEYHIRLHDSDNFKLDSVIKEIAKPINCVQSSFIVLDEREPKLVIIKVSVKRDTEASLSRNKADDNKNTDKDRDRDRDYSTQRVTRSAAKIAEEKVLDLSSSFLQKNINNIFVDAALDGKKLITAQAIQMYMINMHEYQPLVEFGLTPEPTRIHVSNIDMVNLAYLIELKRKYENLKEIHVAFSGKHKFELTFCLSEEDDKKGISFDTSQAVSKNKGWFSFLNPFSK